ncbi:MAG: hypothetical protein LBP92_00555 [Deltaproteobacteria bacterium]|nr:hypothetical protein [Deltaproteobacteria bacterium]
MGVKKPGEVAGKGHLVIAIEKLVNTAGITQGQAAEIVGIPQPELQRSWMASLKTQAP